MALPKPSYRTLSSNPCKWRRLKGEVGDDVGDDVGATVGVAVGDDVGATVGVAVALALPALLEFDKRLSISE